MCGSGGFVCSFVLLSPIIPAHCVGMKETLVWKPRSFTRISLQYITQFMVVCIKYDSVMPVNL